MLQSVSSYKSLGFLIDSCLSFKPHIQQLVKMRLVFHFRGKSHFSFGSKRRLVADTFMHVIDNSKFK